MSPAAWPPKPCATRFATARFAAIRASLPCLRSISPTIGTACPAVSSKPWGECFPKIMPGDMLSFMPASISVWPAALTFGATVFSRPFSATSPTLPSAPPRPVSTARPIGVFALLRSAPEAAPAASAPPGRAMAGRVPTTFPSSSAPLSGKWPAAADDAMPSLYCWIASGMVEPVRLFRTPSSAPPT